ncbi:MAG TPA: DUF6152 family protein [Bryobacteraceae bacterium]
MAHPNIRISLQAAALLLAAGTLWAHHNMAALFDFNNRVTLTGTFIKVDWRNPHIELIVDAQSGADAAETWSIEGPPPSFFRTHNIVKTDFESALGKTVTIEASRARNGSHSGLLRVITLPGGKVVSACPQNC